MSIIKRLGIVCAATVSLGALAGCVDDYGYGGVEVGYGPAAPGYDGYYDGYYGGGAYGDYYPGYYGWYGGYYYPGSGIYVYDRDRRPHRWNGNQQHYWQTQRHGWANGNGGRGWHGNPNWGGFNRGTVGTGAGRPAGQAFRGSGGFHGGGGSHGGGGRHH